MFCKQCGNKIDGREKFCRKCGASIESEPVGDAAAHGMSSKKKIAIIISALAVILAAVISVVIVSKVRDNKKVQTRIYESTDKDKERDDLDDSDALDSDEKDLKSESADAAPIKKPVLYEDYQYTELGNLICTMVENKIVTENGNLLDDHSWGTVTRFLQICDRMTGIGYDVADNIEYDAGDWDSIYHLSKSTLKKLSYSLFSEELELDSLNEVAHSFGEWAIEVTENAEKGYAFEEDDELVIFVGSAGYEGPTASHFRSEYLGNGMWQIVANVVESGYSACYDGPYYPIIMEGILVVTVAEDDNALFGGYRIVDAKYENINDDRYIENWQRAYCDIIQEAYSGNSDLGNADYGWGFDLIYFNDDDIPDLVCNNQGFCVAVYCYDGESAYKAFFGNYGIAGLNGYEYVSRRSIVSWADMDYAGLQYYCIACRINDNHELEDIYDEYPCVKYYVDSNNNGMPDEDEEVTFEDGRAFYFIGDREVTEEEFDEYISVVPATDGELTEAELSYEQVLEKIFADEI